MSTMSPELLRAKLIYARELIKSKKYQEARLILQTINHPKAKQWLIRIDELEAGTVQKTSVSRHYFDTPKKKPSQLRRFGTGLIIILVGMIIFILFIGMVSSFGIGGNNSPSQQPQVDISEKMLAIQPKTVEITDPNNTNIPRSFLEATRRAVSQYGYVSFYEGIMTPERRLRTDLEITLANSGNQTNMGLKVVEEMLRLYAREFSGTNNGESISSRVFWLRDGMQCATGVGMGYRIMETINWQNVTQSQIFNAIDKNDYADTGARDFTYMGWKPSITGSPICRS